MTGASPRAKLFVAIGALAAMCAIVGVLSLTTAHLDTLELKSYDFLLTVLRGPRPAPADVVIVAIDESSLKEFAPHFAWPWPRSVHGELIRQLNAGGAKAIVFDVVFDLPSADPAEDAAFAAAIAESRAPVVLAAALEDVQDRQFQMTQRIVPLPALAAANARIGFATLHKDVDEVVRRLPLTVGGSPSLSAAALEASGDPVRPASVPSTGGRDDPEFLVNYAGPARSIATVSYYQAIDAAQSLPHDAFAGKTVFVGRALSAQDLAAGARGADLLATPFDAVMPGVEIHASGLATLASRQFVRRAPPLVNWLLLVLSGLVISAVMLAGFRLRAKLVAAAVLIALGPIVAAAAFAAARYWIYSVQPLLIASGVFVLNALYQYRVSERERVFVRRALTGYVSKPVMQRILDQPGALELGGAQVEATVLFSDIAGFSGIAERMSPRELTGILNAYFTTIGDVVMAHDGMIDKYIGDAIMAVWGAPLPDPGHAAHACAAALAMTTAVRNAGGPISARIGINTGAMMAGNLGHRERMEYTVIGDAVNLSSRLEGANKLYGTAILVSESTMNAARDRFVFRQVDRIRVVGKRAPVVIYELIGVRTADPAGTEEARLASYAAIVEAYDRRDFAGALAAAARHRASHSGDPVVAVYEERCQRFLAQPPPADWDGVYTFASK